MSCTNQFWYKGAGKDAPAPVKATLPSKGGFKAMLVPSLPPEVVAVLELSEEPPPQAPKPTTKLRIDRDVIMLRLLDFTGVNIGL